MDIKKIILFVLVMLATFSCKRGISENEEPVSDKDERLTFVLTPVGNISNLQVGDRMLVSFKIEDSDTLGVRYVLRPKTENKVFHQRINEDFSLYVKNKKEPVKGWPFRGGLTKVDQISIKSSELNGQFYIEVLEPGNFQHEYILEKFKNDKKVSSESRDLLFSAVKIYAETYSVQIRDPGLFQRSKHRRFYKFVIDDGNERYDEYLTTGNSKSHTYQVNYAGSWHSEGDGSFSAHTKKDFRAFEDREKKAPDVPAATITEIKIQQKHNDGSINNIIYKDIPVVQK
ncbi:hypothetical protein JSO59_007890 [Riemerella anatipestifer]|uniref:hypothetical protein n=1 Tax=Riemerella anatipestifer TaxID=34085 RepID=UPI0030C2A970